jgi:NNP family nitrate/nitrite transporter-like MFS transporter
MGTMVYPALERYFGNADTAWRVALLFPALVAMCVAYFFNRYSDDCPLGNYAQVQRAGLMQERSAMDSFRSGILNLNAWFLFLQYVRLS